MIGIFILATTYIGPILINEKLFQWIVDDICKRLNREGILKSSKTSKVEVIVNDLERKFYNFIPVFNLFITIRYLFWMKNFESVYNKVKKEKILNGSYIPLSEQEQALLEETQTKSENDGKTLPIDTFIANIQKDILEIASIQYEGFKEDIETLYKMALKFLEARKENEEYSVLSASNEWYKTLIDIEFKLEEKRKIKDVQNANREALEQTMEYLKQNGINISVETEDQDPEEPPILERSIK